MQSRVVFVTGPSGAGRSTALHVLEDLGFESIDNMPLSLVSRLLDGPELTKPLGLGIDIRNRDFDPAALIALLDELRERRDVDPALLFLDTRPEVLLRRYSETRRRHPFPGAQTVEEGIASEAALLRKLDGSADIRIDTSELTPHGLRAELTDQFARRNDMLLAVTLLSFSYKHGLPQGADLVFDCRFLRNPHWENGLRAKTGQDPEVAEYVRADPNFHSFFEHLLSLCALLLPAYRAEGKSHLTLALGCSGGRHRSVSVAESLAESLANKGWQVSIRHREIGGRGLSAPV